MGAYPGAMKPLTWSALRTHLASTPWADSEAGVKRMAIVDRVVQFLGPKARVKNLTQKKANDVVELLHRGAHGRTLRPGSVRTYLTVFQKMLSVARDLGEEVKPVRLDKPRVVPEDKQVISLADERLLFDSLELAAINSNWHRPGPGQPKPGPDDILAEFYRFGWWVKFMLGTGMRPGEACRVKRGDVTLRDPGPDGQERWRLDIPETKTKHPRWIPLHGQALEAYQRCEPYGLWQDWTPETIRHRFWNKLMETCQFTKRYTLYDLRHTAITRWVEAGKDIHWVSRVAGHKNLAQTQTYVHRSEESMFQAVEVASN